MLCDLFVEVVFESVVVVAVILLFIVVPVV
jgi:hypothetical protein